MIQAPSLSSPNIRHAFFTREGGVSEGIYESLNGGIGSNDAPENVRENRARMAAALGVAPTHLVSCFQIHSPNVIVAAATMDARELAARRRDRDARAGPRGGRRHRGLRAGAVRRRRSRRRRRRACGMEGRAHRRARGDSRGDGKARRRARADQCGDRPADPPAELRGRRGIRRPLHGGGRRERALLRAGGARTITRCSTCPATSRRGSNARSIKSVEDLGLCTYADPARFFSYRRTTHRGEPDYGRHVNAIALVELRHWTCAPRFGAYPSGADGDVKLGGMTARAGWVVSG